MGGAAITAPPTYVKGGLKNVRKFLIALMATTLEMGMMGGTFAYFQGDTLTTNVTFTLNQHSSQ